MGSDRLFAVTAWSGAALGAAMAAGLGDVLPLWGAMLGWLALWVLYLSIVNVGQLWYAFGWETLLLEAGFSRQRYELVIEGTDDPAPGPQARWLEYGFRCKPGDPRRLPPQVAPYHLRLDWLMWFAALSRGYAEPWLPRLLDGLLAGDPDVLRLLRDNPFPGAPPARVRVSRYHYKFTSWRQLRQTGAWWERAPAGIYLEPPPGLAAGGGDQAVEYGLLDGARCEAVADARRRRPARPGPDPNAHEQLA